MHLSLIYPTGGTLLTETTFPASMATVSTFSGVEPFLASKDDSFDVLIFESPESSDLESVQDMIRRIRAGTVVPILAVTPSQSSAHYREALLRAGADACTLASDDADELLIRVQKLYHKRYVLLLSGSVFVQGDISVDVATHRVMVKGEEVHLTRSEYILLLHLLFNQHTVTEPEMLALRCRITPSSINVHIGNIRKKLGDTHFIHTIPSLGYTLEKASFGV